MAEDNKQNVFGGFEALAGEILNTPGQENVIPDIDPDKLLEKEAEKEEEEESEEKELTEDEKLELEEAAKDDDEEEEKEEKTSKVGDEEEVDIGDFDEYEEPLTKVFQESLYDELGWDIEEGEEKTTIKDLVEYMKNAVSEASKPQYATEELQKLDDFVKQGGQLGDYFDKVPGGTMDLENLDLTNENVQKNVIRELLTTVNNYKEDRVKRTLDRFEDGGILEEQAEDAVELLKEYKEDKQQKLLDGQENYDKQVKQQQQNFYSDVEDSIKDLKDIRGIKISNKDKKELLDYIFKPESDGRTKYQKEYASNVRHLIDSAFFTKDKDKNTLVTKAKQSAKSDAYKELHQKIKASKGKRQKSSGGQDEGEVSDMLGKLGHSLIRKI
jgi:hypothetical protein